MSLFQHDSKVISFLLAAGLLAGTCGAAEAQTAGAARRAALVPNSKKYSNKGAKPATGRAGSANVTARALMAKDRTTDVEVTTGALDAAATPPGQLARVQLKTLSQSDQVVYAKNFNGLAGGGYFKTTLDDVQRGQPLQVQANVRGIDGSRTGVVTLLTNVGLRPDLRATDLSAPAQAVKGAQVNIAATISETNYDVGASARCVLYVDGEAADSALGIWADAGDSVSCAFSHLFATAGTHQLRVSVDNVSPGDYDTSNNSAEGSIDITDPAAETNYSASVYEGFYDFNSTYESHWRRSEGAYLEESDYGSDYRRTDRSQAVNLSMWVYRAVAFPVNVSVREFNDGAQVSSVSFAGVEPDYEYPDYYEGWTYRNASRYDDAAGIIMHFTTTEPVGGETAENYGFTTMQYFRYAGKVTFYSADYSRYWNNYDDPQYFYSYNNTESGESGIVNLTPFGSEYRLDGLIGSADGPVTYNASAVMSLQSSVQTFFEYPYACGEIEEYPYFQRYCSGSYARTTSKTGSASYGH